MFLKVVTLSDITNGTGNAIRTEIWHGRRTHTGREDKIQWPNWGRPSLQNWHYWRTAMKLTFCTQKDRLLFQPLQRWLHIPSGWKWYSIVDPKRDTPSLLEKTTTGYLQYKRVGRSKLHTRYQETKLTYKPTLIDVLIPTTIQTAYKSVIMSPPYTARPTPNTTLTSTYQHTSWLNIDRTNTGSQSKLANALKTGHAIGVSDGS